MHARWTAGGAHWSSAFAPRRPPEEPSAEPLGTQRVDLYSCTTGRVEKSRKAALDLGRNGCTRSLKAALCSPAPSVPLSVSSPTGPVSEAPLLSQMGRTWEKLLSPRAGQPQAAPSLSGLLKLVQFFNRGPISFTNGGPRGARPHLFRACALAGPHCPASRPRVGPLSSPPAGAAYR